MIRPRAAQAAPVFWRTTFARRRSTLEAEGATALFIYGSRARGDFRADSDLDVFVDHNPARKFSLLDLTGIKLILEQALGRACHVTTRDRLHPSLKARIEPHRIAPKIIWDVVELELGALETVLKRERAIF